MTASSPKSTPIDAGHPGGATKSYLRGSSLLLAGRILSLLLNFGVQVLIVRYLSKAEYGTLAFALTVMSFGASVALLGLGRGVNRFVPIDHERGDHARMFGTILLATGTVIGVSVVLVLIALALYLSLPHPIAADPRSAVLLLILLGLLPILATENLLQGLAATFIGARSIFMVRHVLGPGLKLGAVVLVVALGGDVELLAWCYLLAAFLGILAYCVMLYRALSATGLLGKFNPGELEFPVRRLFAFSVPLISTDVLLVLKLTVAVVLLEYYHGPEAVAELRAVYSVAALCVVVFESSKFLFTPLTARLYAREEHDTVRELYWRCAIWVMVVTFPVFAVCFYLAEPVTVLLFGERYAVAGQLLAVLATAHYASAALGLGSYALQVYGKVRFITMTNLLTSAVVVAMNLLWVPNHRALGAASAVAISILAYAGLNLAGVLMYTGIGPLPRQYYRAWAWVLAATTGLSVMQHTAAPILPVMILAIGLSALLLVRLNREALDVESTFPELARVPGVGRLLGFTRRARP